MGNRVYLYCTSATEIPKNNEWDNFFAHSGTEYETQYCIPLYWLILFRESDIKILPGDHNGFTGDEREYPYLLGDRKTGINRLKQFSHLIKQGLGDIRHNTYLEWINRLESENFPRIIVRTEELDWSYSEGKLEEDLRKALNHIDVMSNKSEFVASNTVKDICGIDVTDDFSENESFVLVGSANDSSDWPTRYTQPHLTQQDNQSFYKNTPRFNLGILTFPVALVVAAAINSGTDLIFGYGYYKATTWPKLIAGFGAAFTVWKMGSYLNKHIPENKNKHSFLWLRIEYWSPIILSLWLLLLLYRKYS